MKQARTPAGMSNLSPDAARQLLLAALGGQIPEPAQPPEPRPDDADEEPPLPKLASTMAEFCKAHSISTSTYRRLKLAGKGPVEMEIMADVRISVESAAEWRRSREAGRQDSH